MSERSTLSNCLWATVTVATILVPLVITLWIWDVAYVPFYVLSGELFQSQWNRVHAGISMDQPTIGKWYFWSTVFCGGWTASIFLASRLFKHCGSGLRVFGVLMFGVSLIFYLSILTVPFYWTIQYIGEMGWTPNRAIALAWGAAGYMILISITFLLSHSLLKINKKREQCDPPNSYPRHASC